VNGLFEGLPSSAVILYAFWSMGFPTKEDPITELKWLHERPFLAVLGSISFLSSGLGLLELDFCTSKAISRRMRRSTKYEVVHWLFRTTEVASRVTLFINFMVMTRQHVDWWRIPLAVDFAVTFLLVTIFGGVEKAFLVRPLCSVPCVFANIFLFIDSPIKRRAASKVTWCLTVKHGIELVILPLLAYLSIDNFYEELQANWEMHGIMNAVALLCIPMYWILLWWVTSTATQRHHARTADIFSACASGDVTAMRCAIRELTNSAAVGLNINIFDIDGNTPLILAAANGHDEICQQLLQEGARVEVRMFGDNRPIRNICLPFIRRCWTALHIAAHRGHTEVVRTLLKATCPGEGRTESELALEDFQDTIGDTPLHVAARAGHAEVASLLAIAHPDWANAENMNGQIPADLTGGASEVRRAIEQSIAEPIDLVIAPPTRRMSTDQWPEEELSIVRSSRDASLMAPGLSSYIASSCGGALGKVFLSEMYAAGGPLAAGHLPNISDSSASLGSSLLSQVGSTSVSLPVVANLGEQQLAAPALTMGDLEPIDRSGQPVRWWLECLLANPASAGRQMINMPEESHLGEGSYGLVWRARDRNTGQWYAVKNIRTRRGTTSVAMRECEVADHIRLRPHPCLVRLVLVHNFTDAGLYVLVMEFCPGGDILGRIKAARAKSRLGAYTPPRQALRWIGQVFLGLEHMHLRMFTLLRDLKPENVVLTEDGCAKLTDFGFGRFGVESPGCWSFGIPSGSPGYVSPEILRQEEYDDRADLYSLGVLTWVLFTGGLRNHTEPQPPMGRMKHGADFQAHYQDCALLARCIASPDRHNARALGQDARDFVVRLIDRHPGTRMRHSQIRAHEFLQPLQLPAFNALRPVVDAWCNASADPAED